MRLEGFAGDGVAGSAARAVDADGLLGSKELVALAAEDRGEEVEHPFLRATAFEAEATGLEKGELDVGIEAADGFLVEGAQPAEVAIRLRGNHHKVFVPVAEEPDATLFAFFVELLDRGQEVAAIELDNAAAGGASVRDDVGVEHAFLDGADVFAEDICHDRTGGIVSGGEDIDPRVGKVDRPGADLIPGTARAMEGDRSQRVAPEGVALGREPQAAIHAVEIPRGKKFGERAPGDERVPAAGKIRADFNVIIHGHP